jgi:outer membrane receptor protein involved in Fe transport
VVNISTRQPESHVLSLEASYGNQQTVDGSLFASGRTGSWGASLAAASFHTDGYIIVDERERGPVDTPAGARNSIIKLTLERSLSQSAKVFASASFFGEARANGTRLQINRTHIRQFVVGGDWQSQQKGTFSLRAYGGTQVFDQTFSAVSQTRETEALIRIQRVPAQSTGVTFQWSRAIFNRHTVVAGLEAREVRGASDEQVLVSGRVNSLVGAGGRERSLGVFVEDVVALPRNIFLTVGARIDAWRNFAALSATRPLAQPALAMVRAFPDRTETAVSPHLSALYKPTNHLSLYVSASRAFRAPTLNELYRSFRVGDVLTLANENLSAERLTGVEAGASADLLKQRLNVRANVFWSEITRPIANVTLSVAPGLITRQRQNLGRTRSRGLEVEFESRPFERFTLSGGYLFADAIVQEFPANILLEGLLIPQVPRHQLTLQARYVNPSLVTFGLQARASGGQFDDDQNRFRLNKYFTLDALLSRRFARGFEAFIAAENIFNTRYDIGLTPVRTTGPPLLVRFGFKLQLGSR